VVLGLDPSQVVALVDQMEADGFVQRGSSVTDRRTRPIVATAAGSRVRRAAAGGTHASERDLLNTLTASERATLRGALRELLSP
jgi:DNA-binding MarR family transcriptional regulator